MDLWKKNIMQITRFEVEFVERTQRILIEYSGEYKLTNLLNCMIGLIVLPNERAQNDFPTLWERDIKDIPIYSDLKINIFNPIRGKDRNTGVIDYYPTTLKVFLRKLRNSIAHQNIEPINEGGLFVGAVFRNKIFGVADFESEFRRRELEAFANFIANQYLHHIR
jgi:hypothetical protein